MHRLAAVGFVLAACGGTTGASRTGGESHFLRTCSTACGDGLKCISGLCTRGCVLGKDSCADLAENAECTDQSIESGAVVVCDVGCSGDGDCASLGDGYDCQGGFCRGTALSSAGTGGKGSGGGSANDGGAPSDSSGGAGNSAIVSGSGGAANGEQSCRVLHQTYRSGTSDIPDPSGCGTCECDDGHLSCQEPGCEIGPLVRPCTEGLISDPIDVSYAVIVGDRLVLDVAHGGGCATHDYGACYETTFNEPRIILGMLRLLHDAHGDTCEAYLTETLQFDLRPYAKHYEEMYLTEGGLIDTNYGLYAFGALTCDERTEAASLQVASAIAQFDLSCETDSDCEWASNSTDCSQGCGGMIAGSQAARLAETLEGINSTVCAGYEEECGPLLIHPCTAPGTVACVDGVCTEEAR